MSTLAGSPGSGYRLPGRLRRRGRQAAALAAAALALATWSPGAGTPVRAADSYTIIGTIPVGGNPAGIALSPDGRLLYVTNLSSRDVSVISTGTDKVTATIRVGRDPTGVAVTPDGRFAYVVYGLGAGAVAVIRTGTNAVTGTVTLPAGSYPQQVAVSPDGRLVYVTNWGLNSMSVISTATGTATGSVPVGIHPTGVTGGPGDRAYVANQGTGGGPGTVSVIDTARRRVVSTIALGAATGPWGVATGPASKLYVTNASSHTVSVINTATGKVTGTIAVGTAPYGVAVSSATARAFVTNSGSQTLSTINTGSDSVTATVPGLQFPTGDAVCPTGGRIYVANQTVPGTVSVIAPPGHPPCQARSRGVRAGGHGAQARAVKAGGSC